MSIAIGDNVDIYIGDTKIGRGKVSGFPIGKVTVETPPPGASITLSTKHFGSNGDGGWQIVIADKIFE